MFWVTSLKATSWKYGVACLLYKKGEPSNPKNFRHIILTTTLFKLFFTFLNEYALRHMLNNDNMAVSQKAFLPETSGCLDYQLMLEEILAIKGPASVFLAKLCSQSCSSK
jgi:hypothetical protein